MPPKESLDIGRRSWLKAVGAGAVGLTVAGTAVAADRDNYETVVNVVEEGAARDASESINDILEDHRADSVLFEFPEGEYLMDRKFRHTDFEEFGIVGDGASIVPAPADEFESEAVLFKLGTHYAPGGRATVEGITFDFTAENTGLRGLQIQCNDLYVADVTFAGQHDAGTWGPAQFDVVDSGTTAVIENVRMPDGGAYTRNTAQDADPTVDTGPTGIIVSPYHVGTLVVRNCEVGPFPDNGLYASSRDGRIHVEGGTYWNSNVANVRIAGDRSTVEGASVVVDENRDDDVSQHGIRLDDGTFNVTDTEVILEEPNGNAVRVTNQAKASTLSGLDLRLADKSTSNDGIVVSEGAGETTIRDSTVEINCPGQAIQLEPGDGAPAIVERVTVVGDASGGVGGRHAIVCGRDGCELRDLAVNQPGPEYRRALRIAGDDVTVVGGRYHSTHIPIVNNASGTHIEDITAWAEGGTEGAKFYAENANVKLLNSTIYDGYIDYGTENFTTRGNEFPEGEPDDQTFEPQSTETETRPAETETQSRESETSEPEPRTETETSAPESTQTEASTPRSTETETKTSTTRSTETRTETSTQSSTLGGQSSPQSAGTPTATTDDGC